MNMTCNTQKTIRQWQERKRLPAETAAVVSPSLLRSVTRETRPYLSESVSLSPPPLYASATASARRYDFVYPCRSNSAVNSA